MDALTTQIVQHVSNLPFTKKKAILELLKVQFWVEPKQTKSFQKNWKKELLKTSVWTDAEIKAIHEAREFINQWTPRQFS